MQISKMSNKRCAVLTAIVLVLAFVQHVPQSAAQSSTNATDACSGVNCQQGTCEAGFIGYSCKCQDGWENILELPFLPCGIPKDCQLNLSCAGDSPAGSPGLPSPAPFTLPNFTDFNPCTFSLCGFGKCVAHENPGLLTVPYSCQCDPGNSNVMNMSSGTCLPNCNFGASCTQLGLPLSNSTQSAPPSTITTPPSEVCKHVDCWKGKCEPAFNIPGLPQYQCVCEKGWMRPFNFPTFPCAVPNCRIPDVLNCGLLSHPESITPPHIQDLFNPCAWPICGEGECIPKAGSITSPGESLFTCQCDPGNSNLLNTTSSICVPDCCIPECFGGQGGCLAQQSPAFVPVQTPPTGLLGHGNRTEVLNAGVTLKTWKRHILVAIAFSIHVCS
ncbi:hypothetical protein MPTK1_3g15400 [Marchantia polymorpha subsp. ruderalis]|uniref:EGF-like domain-containing protein n=2 Tax=Marchantia polymorpha TaxID=3197 RepID=A0AAF6B128_MARPO|nr:hypothetical protein MARPO_0004s0132 [Marchantia polymorpha]BBN05712.1 hypothetical protein Mp_3g15400 [Marchantia polymorpha subsp. ruderalis]|eukprot:PTQ48869.1 hypothetical protein MARPO_0004s0132 [Marchantia polymorpha]